MKRTITLVLLIWLSAQAAYCQEDLDSKVAPAEAQDSVSITVQKNGLHERIFGIELGVGDAWLFSPSVTNGAVLSWRVGGFVYIHLTGKLYLQPGLCYATSGGAQFESNAYSGNTTTYALHQIEVPVNIGFRYGHRKVNYKSFFGIGGYIARNMSGTVSGNGSWSETLNIGTNPNNDIKPFDVGVGLNASTEWRCGLSLRVRFQYGLTNLEPSNGTMNSFGYGFQLGYLFGKKPPLVRKRIKWTTGDDNYIAPRMQ